MRNRIAQTWSSIKASAGASVSDMASVGGYLLSSAKSFLGSPEVKQAATEGTLQAIEGMSPTAIAALPKAWLKYEASRDTIQAVLWKGAISYAIPAIGYRLGLRPILLNAVEGTYAKVPFYVADTLVNLYYVRASLNLSLDMIFYGLAIAKTTTPSPEELKHDHESLVPCPEKCGALVNQQASFMAQLGTIASVRAARLTGLTASTLLVSYEQPIIPILGTIVAFPFLRLIEGRTLVGYKLAAVGMCSDHREDILSANNWYCFGRGLANSLTLRMLSFLASKSMIQLIGATLGVDLSTGNALPVDLLLYLVGFSGDSIVEDALSNLVWLSFTVAETQVNNVLPGKQRGIEIFYWPNLAVKKSLMWLVDKVTLAFKPKDAVGTKANNDELDFAWTAPVVKVYQAEATQKLLTFINSDLLTLDRFLKRRSVEKFSNAYSKVLHENIDWFKSLRKGKVPKFILRLIPEAYVSSSSKEILITLRRKRWDAPVAYIEQFIHRVCPTEFTHLPHAVSLPALQEAEATVRIKKIENEANPETASLVEQAKQIERSSALPIASTSVTSNSILTQNEPKKRKQVAVRKDDAEEPSRMSAAAQLMLSKNKED